jgi:hypothetical protein
MAVVVLGEMWLHRADDFGTFVTFHTSGRSDLRRRSGDVRSRSGGRLQIVTRTERRQTLAVTARAVDETTVQTLDSWAGTKLMLRDHLGRVLFGAYFDLSITDYPDQSGHDVSFTFQQSSGSAEV